MIQTIPIFMASDENYAPFLCTAMYSIVENTKSYISFNILDGGISNISKELIKKSLTQFNNYSIEYINMSAYNLDQFPNLKHYSVNTFSRYFIANIAKNINKCLYMDVDIIVNGDILTLYEQDLQNYPLGAVLEDFYSYNYTNLKESIYPEYKGGSNYFNAGILVMDLKYFRDNNLEEKLIKMTSDLFDKLSCPDQDVFNIIFENNFKILEYVYNYMPDHYALLEKHKSDIANYTKQHALVYHFTGGKPWKNDSCESALFWNYAKKTGFYKVIKQKYKKKLNLNALIKRAIKAMLLKLKILKYIKTENEEKFYMFGILIKQKSK